MTSQSEPIKIYWDLLVMQSMYRHYQVLMSKKNYQFINLSIYFFSVILKIIWTVVSSITELQNTQYHINCITSTVNVTTDVYWLVNGVMKYNSMYTLIDSDLLIYNNTLLVYPDLLGVSVNVTCIAMYKGVNHSDTVILQGM